MKTPKLPQSTFNKKRDRSVSISSSSQDDSDSNNGDDSDGISSRHQTVKQIKIISEIAQIFKEFMHLPFQRGKRMKYFTDDDSSD